MTFSRLEKRALSYKCRQCGKYFKEGVFGKIENATDYTPYQMNGFFDSRKSTFGVDLCSIDCARAFLVEFVEGEEDRLRYKRLDKEVKEVFE